MRYAVSCVYWSYRKEIPSEVRNKQKMLKQLTKETVRVELEGQLQMFSQDELLGNRFAKEGCTRCECGSKYWENDICHSCGKPFLALVFEGFFDHIQ